MVAGCEAGNREKRRLFVPSRHFVVPLQFNRCRIEAGIQRAGVIGARSASRTPAKRNDRNGALN
jgi:hypothetical protein